MQIYETILHFKQKEPNPYGLKIDYTFRYNSFRPKSGLLDIKPPTMRLYIYILTHLRRGIVTAHADIDAILEQSMTVNLHPDAVGIPRQNMHRYINELIDLNFIAKAGPRGYDYYVNPYYYNVLSKPLAQHCFTQMLLLLRA